MDREIKTTEMHCGGGAVRIIDSGFPKLTQPTLLGKRREVTEKHDKIRSYLLSEPRGHSDLYGVVPCDSELEEADLGVLLMHNAGMGIMCGHAIMAVARYAVDKGIVKRAHDPSGTSVNIHCPCGLVKTTVLPDNSVTFISVPSFVAISGLDLRLSSGRQVKVDIVFGGTFYALLDSTQLGIHISEEPICQLTQLGEEIKNLVNSTQKLLHPESEDLCICGGTLIHDGVGGTRDSANILVYGNQQVERSAGGSCVSARLAHQFSAGDIQKQEIKVCFNSKVPHSMLSGKVIDELELVLPDGRAVQAVRTAVTGRPFYIGENKYFMEEDDFISKNGGFLIQQ